MDECIPHGKRVLVVNDDPDVLTILEKQLLDTYPNCNVEKATSYREAVKKLISWTYDLVVLDITRVWSFHLLNQALRRNFPVVIFTSLLQLPKLLVVSTKEEERDGSGNPHC